MFSSVFKFFVIFSLLLSFSVSAIEQCEDVFPDAINSFGPRLESVTFLSSNSNTDFNNADNLNLGAGQYSNVSVSNNGTLNFTDTDGEYRIRNLSVNNNATVNFVAGDYYFTDFNLRDNAVLNVVGSGTVRIFIQSNANFSNNSVVNADQDPLLMVVLGSLNGTQFDFNGLLYVQNNLNVSNISLNGAVTSSSNTIRNLMNNQNTDSFVYNDRFLSTIDFDGLCIGSSNNIAVDHYQILHEPDGLTCAPENITIRACSNSFDSSNATCSSVEQSFSLTVNADNSAVSSLSFTSSATFNYSNATVETVTLSISNVSESASNGFRCINSNTNNESNCEVTFTDTSFIFSTNNVQGIEDQLSGKGSNVGYNAGTISIATDDDTGACAGVFVNENIELAAQCTDSSTCTSNLSINSSDIITAANTPTTYTSLDLGFAGSDSANIVLNYPDAGSLTLHARYNIPIDGVPSGNFIEGSAEFTVRPLGFDVAITGTNTSGSIINPAAQDASGDAFVAAGDNVDVQITAKQWQAADDTNNDGIPDIDADLSNNTTTINFIDNVEITHQLVSPLGGENPNLSNNSTSLFNNGVATVSTSWPEVGILSFTVQIDDNNYLGAGDVQGFAPFVGRFIPSYYQQTVDEHGSLMANSNSWVYSGETDGTAGTIRYDTLPVYRITAFSADDTITENYTIGGDFIKLMTSGISVDEPSNDHLQLGVNVIDNVTLTAELITGTLEAHTTINGALTYTFNDLDHFFYTKEANSEIAPFVAQVPLAISNIIDSDGVTYGTDSANNALLESAIATGIEVRFGRLFIPNSYGPETEPLTIPMQLQVFDGVTYRIHNDDSNTELSTENNEVALIYDGTATDYLATNTASVNAITSTPVQGYIYFIDLSSNNNERGRVDLEYTTVDWLQHDWSGDSIFDENPTATAQFGVFRGNDRIILWREINQ